MIVQRVLSSGVEVKFPSGRIVKMDLADASETPVGT